MAGLKSLAWWQWIPRPKWRIVATVETARDIPDELPRKTVVVVADEKGPKWLAFDCPCSNAHRILLNLDTARAPYWTLAGDSEIDLTPSIDVRSSERRCHFIIREGKVDWINRV